MRDKIMKEYYSPYYHNYFDLFHKLVPQKVWVFWSSVETRVENRRAFVYGNSQRWNGTHSWLYARVDSHAETRTQVAERVRDYRRGCPARASVTTNGSRKWPRIDSWPGRSWTSKKRQLDDEALPRYGTRHETRPDCVATTCELSTRRRRRDAHVLSIDRTATYRSPVRVVRVPGVELVNDARSLFDTVGNFPTCRESVYLWCRVHVERFPHLFIFYIFQDEFSEELN